MKNRCQSLLANMPILQRFPSVEFHEHHYFPDFHPFSLELSTYTERVRSVALAFFIAGLLAICTTLSFELRELNPAVTAENALLELAQIFCLILATLVQGVRAFGAADTGLARSIRAGLALLTCAILLREVDMDKFGASPSWGLAENLLRAVIMLVISGFILHMLRKKDQIMRNIGKILLSPTVLISILACILYACGWPLDKELLNIDKDLSIWAEETLELNACLLFVCASLTNNTRIDTAKTHSPSF
jgi:hypothetical protein